jgi:cytochrome c peroxidase
MKRAAYPLVAILVVGCGSDSEPSDVNMPRHALAGAIAPALGSVEQLGKSIFFDERLSLHANQSCASCHDPAWGFTGPSDAFNAAGAVYEGSIAGRFGARRPPAAAYATQSPIFHLSKGTFVGGNFWDGRATGDKLGNPAADQAQGPFLNPVEQALPDNACVIHRVCAAAYPVTFEAVFGGGACAVAWPADVEAQCLSEDGHVALSAADRDRVNAAYDDAALAIAAYEGSGEVNAFSSKFDVARGKLTKQEKEGLALFKGKAKCGACHTAVGREALFTDYTFDNLGVPRNPQNPALDADPGFVDLGLGGFLRSTAWASSAPSEDGKHKVPTLRNVDRRPVAGAAKAFMHNGYFKTLEQVVHFYNTRDTKPSCPGAYTAAQAMAAGCWPEPEVSANVNTAELGDLGLSARQEEAIVAFMRTLSDGYGP